jgi:hypothetical protein
MAQTDLAVRIATIFDEAGIKKADKAVNKLQKSTSKLGKALGVSLGVAAIAQFGRAAVKAFSEDEKSTAKLTSAVRNLGLAFEQTNINTFITGLEKSASIADEVLRPAFQALLTTTGSVTEAQKLLTTAIDASRGTGYDLATVAGDLSKAYVGNTKGLQKYYLGLSKAQLASMSFEEIQAKINKTFEGANKAYLNTAAGKLEAISIATGNFSETVGGALVQALIVATGSGGVEGLVTKIDKLALATVNAINEFEKFSFITKYLFDPKNILKGSKEYLQALNAFTSKQQMAGAKAYDPLNNSLTGFKVDQKAAADAKKAADLQAKLLKQSLAAQKALTTEQKKQAALKKAGTVFDLEQIQIVAALKGKLSEDDKIRLQAQLALLNGNADLATKLTNQILAAQDSTGNLARFLSTLPNAKNPFEYLDAYLSYLAGKAAAVLTGTTAPNVPSTTASAAAMPTASEMAASGSFSQLVSQGAGASGGFSPVVAAAMAPVINVTVQGNVIREQELINQVLAGAQLSSLSGSPSQIGRIAGMFS